MFTLENMMEKDYITEFKLITTFEMPQRAKSITNLITRQVPTRCTCILNLFEGFTLICTLYCKK